MRVRITEADKTTAAEAYEKLAETSALGDVPRVLKFLFADIIAHRRVLASNVVTLEDGTQVLVAKDAGGRLSISVPDGNQWRTLFSVTGAR